MSTISIFLLITLIVFEIFESSWQSAPNFGAVIEKIRVVYHTNIFLLFLMHPSFYLSLFVYLYYGGVVASIVVIMKGIDIITKLWLVKKVEERSLLPEFRAMFSTPISPVMMWMNVFIYPAMLTFSLS